MKAVLLCVLSVLSGVRSQVRSGQLYVQPDGSDSIYIACDFMVDGFYKDPVCLHRIGALLDWKL
jgi:hypothetical protein